MAVLYPLSPSFLSIAKFQGKTLSNVREKRNSRKMIKIRVMRALISRRFQVLSHDPLGRGEGGIVKNDRLPFVFARPVFLSFFKINYLISLPPCD